MWKPAIAIVLLFGRHNPERVQDAFQVKEQFPMPAAKDQQGVEKEIRARLKADFSDRSTEGCRALAKKLISQVKDVKGNPTEAFVFLRLANRAAADAADLETVSLAIDMLSENFNGVKLETEWEDALKMASPRTREEGVALAESALDAADRLSHANQYTLAIRLATRAWHEAAKAQDKSITELAKRSVESFQRLYAEYQDALAFALERAFNAKVDNPKRDLEFGRFLAVQKGDWERALPLMVKGMAGELSDLAARDLAAGSPKEKYEVAKAWLKFGKGRPATEKKAFLSRALARAEESLFGQSGTDRLDALALISQVEAFYPNLDLLALIRLDRDGRPPPWTKDGSALVTGIAPSWCSDIPVVPPEEYDLVLTVERRSEKGSFNVGFVARGRQFMLDMDSYGVRQWTGISMLDGKGGDENGLAYQKRVFVDKLPRRITCSLRRRRFTVLFDGERIMDWKNPDYRKTDMSAHTAVVDKTVLTVGAYEGAFRISRFTLAPVTGEWKKPGRK